MAYSVKCLSCKYEYLCSSPRIFSNNNNSNNKNKSQVWWNILVIPALGRKKQEDPWGSLASQASLLDKFQDNERPCLNKQCVKTEG